MAKIKHSKLRNSGILFELLVRQVASDTVSGKDSSSINLIKKYFVKTELSKEYKLYQTLINSKNLSESKAESLINTILELSSRLNRSNLRKEKYNLIKEIRETYNIDEFFKAKINNYSQYAAAYNLIEAKNTSDFVDPKYVVENKVTLLEHISNTSIIKEKVQDRVLQEYNEMDKGTRILVYKIMLEKFNEKYSNLSEEQKLILKEYINNISNTTKLREFINENNLKLASTLKKLISTITDKTIQIKLTEVITFLKPLDKKTNVKDDHIMSLLQYYQLVNEIQSVK
jgi:hypothetical protein